MQQCILPGISGHIAADMGEHALAFAENILIDTDAVLVINALENKCCNFGFLHREGQRRRVVPVHILQWCVIQVIDAFKGIGPVLEIGIIPLGSAGNIGREDFSGNLISRLGAAQCPGKRKCFHGVSP